MRDLPTASSSFTTEGAPPEERNPLRRAEGLVQGHTTGTEAQLGLEPALDPYRAG